MKKSRNLSLAQMYREEMAKPTPAKEFLNEICRITNRSEITVRLWVSGKVQPEPLEEETRDICDAEIDVTLTMARAALRK